MVLIEAEKVESVNEETDSYFFSRVGEVCFTAWEPKPDSEQHPRGLGSLRSLAIASSHGWTVFVDQKGKPSLFENAEHQHSQPIDNLKL